MTAGLVCWLTGRPASGKTTIAAEMIRHLRAEGVPTLWLDSDDLRRVMTPHPTYSDEERDTFYRSVAHVATLGAQGGVAVIISATAQRRLWRDLVRAAVPAFFEIEVTCDERLLVERDPKGLYAAAASGLLERLPGRGADYEAPTDPALVLNTSDVSAASLAAEVCRLLAPHLPR